MTRARGGSETGPAGPAGQLLIRGVVLPDDEPRDLYVVAGRVSYEPVAAAREVASGWIVPGLVDAHCHIGLGPDGAVDRAEQERQALAERAAGMLLARDAGAAADTRWIDDRDDLPRIVRAGRHLARTGRYLRNYGIELEPPDLPDAAVRQAGRGDGWVKIVADWIDRDRGDLTPCWPAEVLAEAVRRAQAAGARVTVHTFDEQGVADAIAAGVDCVEHGTGLSEQLIDTMAARGTALVPTLINVANFPAIAERASRYPAYADHMRRMHASAPGRVAMAHEAGVPVFAGTDAGGAVAHGRVAEEVAALHAAGLPADVALGAASWAARRWLGRPELAEGDPADLVVYPTDPRKDLRVLAAPARVILRGRIVL
jgi:imidazolonepropionase-like amidohydrolase